MFVLINSDPLKIEFDPVQILKQYHSSIAFDITTIWSMPYQQAKIKIKECWIENFELTRFEENLRYFLEKKTNQIKLSNVGLEPILRFTRTEEDIIFEFVAKDTVNMGTISVKTKLYHQEVLEVLENIRNWAKWW